MEWQYIFALTIGLLFFLLFMGNWIAFALGCTGIMGLFIISSDRYYDAIASIAWNMTNSFELTAIPLFVLMGEILIHSNLSDIFYRSAAKWFGRLPGGLLQTNILSCSIFAAISGSSPATAAAIGSVAYPEMVKQKYDQSMVIGSLGGGGALGILIPPSIPMIIYGSIAEVSVDKLFIAGIVPGILAAIIFMIYIGIRHIFNRSLCPEKIPPVPWKEKFMAIFGMMPFVLLILAVLGGIYTGFTTPTEAAALGCLVAIILCLLVRGLTIKSLIISLKATIKLTAMILMIVIGAQIMSYFIVMVGISNGMVNAIVAAKPSLFMFFVIISVVYIILGCIIDGTSMIYITVPILLPIMKAMGIDLLWFGVILVIFIELAQITPPVGLNLYVLHGICNNTGVPTSLGTIMKGIMPYCFMYLLIAILVILFPNLALWLPSTMH